ncbi:uncharacterized protein LOC127860586 [Dreissena polymorpha]|uniref:uncharacterized protein LOC127860586 n=1 Tax=Dreissena polymorpha TaxID=45954 RepID=UPI0022640DA0|nr:uncharacterized protein LOC127860586 [Dreissena polymorpha]
MKAVLALFGIALISGLVKCDYQDGIKDTVFRRAHADSEEAWNRKEIEFQLTIMLGKCDTGAILIGLMVDRLGRMAVAAALKERDFDFLINRCETVHKAIEIISEASSDYLRELGFNKRKLECLSLQAEGELFELATMIMGTHPSEYSFPQKFEDQFADCESELESRK